MSSMALTFDVTSSTEGPTVSNSEYDFTLGVFLPFLDLVRQGPYDGRIERVERFGTIEFVSPGRALRFEEDRGRLPNASSDRFVSEETMSDVRQGETHAALLARFRGQGGRAHGLDDTSG